MSFFAQLLAGAASGVGKGMVDQADYNDKLAAQQALLQEKQANALQLQQQRADDRLFQAQTMAALKGKGGGAGGGESLPSMIQDAKTPEQINQLLGTVRAIGGEDAAYRLGEDVFGRIAAREATADFVGLPGQTDIGPSAKVLERVTYDREKGLQGLQKVHALVANKGQIQDYEQGVAQGLVNDLVRQSINTGDSAALRTAGAVSLATSGKDRFGVDGGVMYDKAGVDPARIVSKSAPAGYEWNPDGKSQRVVPGGPADLDAKKTPPKPLPAGAATTLLSNFDNLRRVQDAIELVNGKNIDGLQGDSSATGLKGYLPNQILNRADPNGVHTRAAIADLGSMVIHDRSGAAVTAAEFPRLAPFIPTEKDDPAAVRKKLTMFEKNLSSIINDTTDFYRQDGYKVPTLSRQRPSDGQAETSAKGSGIPLAAIEQELQRRRLAK